MGRDTAAEVGAAAVPLESRPGIILIGPPNAGKRTLLSRLLSVDIPETCDLSTGVLCHGWTIDTKYYSADLAIWTAHLQEGFSLGALPAVAQLSALVMVFDMSDESSFIALQNCVAGIDIQKFEILLCVGNKADLVPGHYAHAEYRRFLQKHGESSSDPHPEFLNYGIDETEGCSLLGGEEPVLEIRKSSLEWCCQNNVEFIEACASNAAFDKCLSVDGDMQGVERLYGALSAYMWPGMVLKSGNRINILSMVHKEEMTDDESDYEIDYERLSGSDEPVDDMGGPSNSIQEPSMSTTEEKVTDVGAHIRNNKDLNEEKIDCLGDEVETMSIKEPGNGSHVLPGNITIEKSVEEEAFNQCPSERDTDQKHNSETSAEQVKSEVENYEISQKAEINAANPSESDEDDSHYGLDDIEKLMGEISNIRDNSRLMPDFQRREMAANLALKLAAMFGDGSDEDSY
ncbi:Small GTPase protein [Dioscorea alata]|uniref:Small GTPase protein n=4 Tax=Dioscorea alata TaxID=55571 RepID=A0ACB7UUW0_DIOAL|nr:Small GTPase protein [Dioscorea alata]KAH7664548.1 Small GTPase protein [Dioscorea alata]KAH7664549.1 Small GTPase protein [Dioscorea alata]KAH7664550.1 Small GTPase protein [Dioscorea alata]